MIPLPALSSSTPKTANLLPLSNDFADIPYLAAMRGSLIQFLLLSLLLVSSAVAHGQTVLINEVVSSNTSLADEDGDTPDWFELRNNSQTTVDLAGWTISDRIDKPAKWTFPSKILAQDEYLQVWASDKDRAVGGDPRTIIGRGASARYLISQATSLGWTEMEYNDAFWTAGPTGIGYGDGDDATTVPAGTAGLLLRIPFDITDVEKVEQIIFDIDFDDAYIAYINGIEVSRSNVIEQANGVVSAQTDREAQLYTNGSTEQHIFNNPADFLTDGPNILAIRLINISATSSDLSCIPFLTLVMSEGGNIGTSPPAELNIQDAPLHTNFKLASEGETLYLSDPQGTLVDSLAFANIPTDASYGRAANGSLVYYIIPTPGAANQGATFEGQITDQVQFSNDGGFVNQLSLSLSSAVPDSDIRYTLDATEPKSTSSRYTGPISITENTVVRAQIYKAGYYPGETAQRTYLFDNQHDIPVISLVTDPDNFFDEEHGIYAYGNNAEANFPHFGANFWEDWERPVHLTIFEDGESTFETGAGVKIFGGWSRGQDQKSLSLFARSEYGAPSFEYKMFDSRDNSSFQAWVLRNAGNDFLNSNIRDATLTSLMEGADLEFQAYRPMAVYLNGTYWGYYNMREKVNEHFLGERTGLAPDEIDILEANSIKVHGSDQEYKALIEFVSSNDLSTTSNYEQVADQIDIENFALYYATQIYFDNTDWPGNNIKYWKGKGGKWRWILYDTDFGFGIWDLQSFRNNTLAFALNPNGPGWPNPPWSTLLFRKLMSNTEFRHGFVNRLADELNSRFLPGRVTSHIDFVASLTSSEAPRHYSRWGGDVNFRAFKIGEMKTFANSRPSQLKDHIRNTLNLPAYHTLTVRNPQHEDGSVLINKRLDIAQSFWSGQYFESVPITLEAVPEDGFVFSHWEGDIQSIQTIIEVDVDEAMTVTPVFDFDTSTEEETAIANRLTIFPSPTAGAITASYVSQDIGYSRIEIFDASGSQVYALNKKVELGKNMIGLDLSQKPAGTYQVRFTIAGKTSITSVVKI